MTAVLEHTLKFVGAHTQHFILGKNTREEREYTVTPLFSLTHTHKHTHHLPLSPPPPTPYLTLLLTGREYITRMLTESSWNLFRADVFWMYNTHTHTHFLSLSLSLTHTHAHTHTLTHTLTHTHTPA